MSAPQKPLLWDSGTDLNAQLPATTFQPTGVPCASEQPPPKTKPLQPFLRFNGDSSALPRRHPPDAEPLSLGTKPWIQRVRLGQILLRMLEISLAAGIVVIMALMTDLNKITAWVLRIVPGVAVIMGLYGVYHLSYGFTGRPPKSAAAYHVFSSLIDLTVVGVYGFGAFQVDRNAGKWHLILDDPSLKTYLVPVLYYVLIGAGCLHCFSLGGSLWLGWIFHRICLLPPDMNPLESHLTARPTANQRKRSSATTLGSTEDMKRLSTPLESHRRSGMPYENLSREPSVPFLHVRAESYCSRSSQPPRINLPQRQYQIVPGNASRSSLASVEPRHLSYPIPSQRGSYSELSLEEPADAGLPSDQNTSEKSQHRVETRLPTDSIISRTQNRYRKRDRIADRASRPCRSDQAYSALLQLSNTDDADVEEFQDENISSENERAIELSRSERSVHPDPLGSNPSAPSPPRSRTTHSPWKQSSLSEISGNAQLMSRAEDSDGDKAQRWDEGTQLPRKKTPWPDLNELSRPYGELKSATPPVIVGDTRKVSSGNDYDSSAMPTRRNVSGKIAEEGRGGEQFSRSPYLRNRN